VDLARHLADPALKQAFVTPMFELVAPRYDQFTRVFSYGMDRRWKRVLVAEVLGWGTGATARVLDVACGTGDLAFALAAALPRAQVTGIDASPRMVAIAARRARTHAVQRRPGGAVSFARGDLSALAAPDRAVDVVTAGYAFRNAPDHRAALAEAARVLRPGGLLAALDFYRPESATWRGLFLGYLAVAGRVVGWWWHAEPLAYGYIAPSIEAFTSVRGFSRDLDSAGFRVLCVREFLRGGIAVHVAQRR